MYALYLVLEGLEKGVRGQSATADGALLLIPLGFAGAMHRDSGWDRFLASAERTHVTISLDGVHI